MAAKVVALFSCFNNPLDFVSGWQIRTRGEFYVASEPSPQVVSQRGGLPGPELASLQSSARFARGAAELLGDSGRTSEAKTDFKTIRKESRRTHGQDCSASQGGKLAQPSDWTFALIHIVTVKPVEVSPKSF